MRIFFGKSDSLVQIIFNEFEIFTNFSKKKLQWIVDIDICPLFLVPFFPDEAEIEEEFDEEDDFDLEYENDVWIGEHWVDEYDPFEEELPAELLVEGQVLWERIEPELQLDPEEEDNEIPDEQPGILLEIEEDWDEEIAGNR